MGRGRGSRTSSAPARSPRSRESASLLVVPAGASPTPPCRPPRGSPRAPSDRSSRTTRPRSCRPTPSTQRETPSHADFGINLLSNVISVL